MEQMTQNKRNQVIVKKMTLELDLNFSTKEMSKNHCEQSTKREARMAERKANKDSVKKQLTSDELLLKKAKC
jgi:hypothetical protein